MYRTLGSAYPDTGMGTATPVTAVDQPDPLTAHRAPRTAHRTRTNTRVAFEPIGYDSEGAPLYAWQLDDEP